MFWFEGGWRARLFRAVTRYRSGIWQYRRLTPGSKYRSFRHSRHGRILCRGRPGPDDSLRHHSGNDRRSPGRHPDNGCLDARIRHLTRAVTQFHRCSCACQTLKGACESCSCVNHSSPVAATVRGDFSPVRSRLLLVFKLCLDDTSWLSFASFNPISAPHAVKGVEPPPLKQVTRC